MIRKDILSMGLAIAVLFFHGVGVGQETEPAASSQEEVFSGPQPGEETPPLTVEPLLDSESNEALDFSSREGESPTAVIFVHEITRPGIGLIRGVAGYCERLEDKIDCAVVFLSDDMTETRQWANRARNALPSDVRLGISPDGAEGPGAWGLNRNMSLTIVVADEGRVKNNFALVQPSAASDGPKIIQALAEVAGVDPPSDEEVAGWFSRQGMSRERMADAEEIDIRSFLAPVIQKDATEEEVAAAAKRLEDEAARNEKFKNRIGDVCRRVVNSDRFDQYGTEAARTYLKKWSETFVDQ